MTRKRCKKIIHQERKKKNKGGEKNKKNMHLLFCDAYDISQEGEKKLQNKKRPAFPLVLWVVFYVLFSSSDCRINCRTRVDVLLRVGPALL